MKGSPNALSHSLKLRVRLTALVAIVVSAVAGLTAWTCLGLAERALESRFEDELVALEVGAVNALADVDIRIETSLTRLSRHLVEEGHDRAPPIRDAATRQHRDLSPYREGGIGERVLHPLDERHRRLEVTPRSSCRRRGPGEGGGWCRRT